MRTDGHGSNRLRTYALLAVDAIAYAVVVDVGSLVLALVGGIVTGGGLAGGNLFLFLAGWILIGFATVRLWPRSPKRAAEDVAEGRLPREDRGRELTRIESLVATLPPLRWLASPPRRFSPPTKLFVAGLLVLVTSFGLEVLLGVG